VLDLGVGPRGLEVTAEGLGCARGGQRDVSTSLGIADGEPPGVEGQAPAQRLEHFFGALVQAR
jgi:hypothetical protein